MGVLVAFIAPGMRRRLDREYRNLPRLQDKGGTLLDLGSGNGAFLGLAGSCGWTVFGADPDSKAVETSIKNGFRVLQGGVECFENGTQKFDVITLSHVIEHFHHPFSTLEKCFQLLKPGGQIWIETPSIDCAGHGLFGVNWRGIEAPRHLVLFNRNSLKAMLSATGFTEIRDMRRPSAVPSLFMASYALERGIPYDAKFKLTLAERWRILSFVLKEAILPKYKELVTITATRVK